jgi:hypothetical protein
VILKKGFLESAVTKKGYLKVAFFFGMHIHIKAIPSTRG